MANGALGFPEQAVHVGHDVDGSHIFVGRAHHAGELLPAKVMPGKGAFVPYAGQEIQVHQVEILCMTSAHTWKPARGGECPVGAINVGTAANGEWLFVGRCHFQGALTLGKIHPTHNTMYVPFGGREHSVQEYECLCTI